VAFGHEALASKAGSRIPPGVPVMLSFLGSYRLLRNPRKSRFSSTVTRLCPCVTTTGRHAWAFTVCRRLAARTAHPASLVSLHDTTL
jgi:hypothetical protein